MTDRWFARHRQEWIAETLRIFGFINRMHLKRKFEVSTAQASVDLRTFQANHPELIEYNQSTKRFELQERADDDQGDMVRS